MKPLQLSSLHYRRHTFFLLFWWIVGLNNIVCLFPDGNRGSNVSLVIRVFDLFSSFFHILSCLVRRNTMGQVALPSNLILKNLTKYQIIKKHRCRWMTFKTMIIIRERVKQTKKRADGQGNPGDIGLHTRRQPGARTKTQWYIKHWGTISFQRIEFLGGHFFR